MPLPRACHEWFAPRDSACADSCGCHGRSPWLAYPIERGRVLPCPLVPLRFLVAGSVAVECARRRELAELVTHHVFGDHHGDVLLAVVDAEHEADELRQDRRTARPGLDHIFTAACASGFCLLQQITVDKRTFPTGACHLELPLALLGVARAHDHLGGALILARLGTLGWLAPRRDRMTAALGAAFAAAMRMVDRVHRGTTNRRTLALPHVATGLADHFVHV